jgi:AraC family 4-hydroxyphenylacetate 3-monooxygenase operon regulatory protein
MQKKLVGDDCSPLLAAAERGEVSLKAFGRGQYPGSTLKPDWLPGLRSIGLSNGVGPQHWGLPMHYNEGIEIGYVLGGQMPFATDSGTWLLKEGDITITRPWQRHCLGNPNVSACKYFWIILDVESTGGGRVWKFPDWIGPDEFSRRELLSIYRKNQCNHLVDNSHFLKDFIVRSYEMHKLSEPLTAAHLAATINAVLLSVASRLSAGIELQPDDPQGYNQAISHFFKGLENDAEKASEPWTLDSMAHACRVGKSYLTVSCRKIFNATPSDQLNLIRLHHASSLLTQHQETTVTEIAFRVGFNSSQYFANCFKRQFGSTPSAYRKR